MPAASKRPNSTHSAGSSESKTLAGRSKHAGTTLGGTGQAAIVKFLITEDHLRFRQTTIQARGPSVSTGPSVQTLVVYEWNLAGVVDGHTENYLVVKSNGTQLYATTDFSKHLHLAGVSVTFLDRPGIVDVDARPGRVMLTDSTLASGQFNSDRPTIVSPTSTNSPRLRSIFA